MWTMNYFSLISKAVLHASFLAVAGSIFSPAVDWGWGNIPALRATTGGGKHLLGIPLPGVLLLLLWSVSCCNRSYIYWLLMLWCGDQIASYGLEDLNALVDAPIYSALSA